jgi:hypothetical protein
MRNLVFATALTVAAVLHAQSANLAAIGPQIGTPAGDFGGIDQFGRAQTLQTLMGRDGLMLVFFRSADW